jgi:hypothetical protein
MDIFKKLYVGAKLALWRLSAGLVKTEEEILKPKDLTKTNEKNKFQIRAEVRNPIARKMQQGKRDEKFVKDYYELLKKADEFIEKANPEKIAQVAASRNMTTGLKMGADGKPIPFQTDEDGKVIKDEYGVPKQKDEFGRRYDHYGFFDPKHKHYGKTIREVTLSQVEERRLKDDDYPIEYMINNEPIVEGLAKGVEIGQLPIPEQAKHFKFPIKIVRDGDTVNKIEQLTEFLHIKKIDSTHRILEFIIPKKFGVCRYDENSKIMKELCDFKQVWHKTKYGENYGFSITGFYKFLEMDKYDVIKLKAEVIEKIN